MVSQFGRPLRNMKQAAAKCVRLAKLSITFHSRKCAI